jgi:hypothetical protein
VGRRSDLEFTKDNSYEAIPVLFSSEQLHESRLFIEVILDRTPSRSPQPFRSQVLVFVKLGRGGGDRIHELYGNKGVLRRSTAF